MLPVRGTGAELVHVSARAGRAPARRVLVGPGRAGLGVSRTHHRRAGSTWSPSRAGRLRTAGRGRPGCAGPAPRGPSSWRACGVGSGASRYPSGASGGDERSVMVRTAGLNRMTSRQQLAAVVEEDHAVAQQAPALL